MYLSNIIYQNVKYKLSAKINMSNVGRRDLYPIVPLTNTIATSLKLIKHDQSCRYTNKI